MASDEELYPILFKLSRMTQQQMEEYLMNMGPEEHKQMADEIGDRVTLTRSRRTLD